MQPAMLQKRAALQYALLTLVALLALTHFYLGAVVNFQNLGQGTSRSRYPFYNGTGAHEFYLSDNQARAAGLRTGAAVPAITLVLPEAKQAGLHVNDAVIAINGRPFTGTFVLLDQLRHSRPGQFMVVTFLHSPAQAVPSLATVKLAAERSVTPPLWTSTLQCAFLFLPFFCLLIGLYVVFARPRSPHAWLILGILANFDVIFIPATLIYSPLLPLALVWSTVAMTAMPVCLMLFGIYFPHRSKIDIRLPWLKWLLLIPVLLFLPIDLLFGLGHTYRFSAVAILSPWLARFSVFENIISACAIGYFFPNLFAKIADSTPDARRRLRVLYFGATIGLSPLFVLVVISLIRGKDVGQDIPQWITIPIFLILLLFPLSLAYVVIVQRAMDVRLLLRQGTKYFFARQSVLVLRIILGGLVGYSLNQFFAHPGHQRRVDVVRIFGLVGIVFAFRFILSKRLQQRIDERFFREAYSSEQVLSELSDQARNFTETQPLLETITGRIGQTLHVERMAVFLRMGDTFRLQLSTGMPTHPNGTHVPSLPASSTTITTLTREKAPANVYRDDPSSWLVDATDLERTALADLSTELLVPLPGRNRLIGVMALGPKRSEEPYSRSDRQLLQTVASQTGLALENAELLENLTAEISQRERVSREIEIAREVQQRLFPQSYPQIPGVGLFGFCRSAHAVGGDYYDLFTLSSPDPAEPPRLALAIGDISGKGISAALLMASLRASLRAIAMLQTGDLAALMRHVNRLVYEASAANRYATFFYAEYDPSTRLLTYINAGHNPPVILRQGQAIPLEATGTVIGLLPDADYEQAVILLHPGDVLLAFTDGISEAMTADEEEWGEPRMIECARHALHHRGSTATAHELLTCILTAADTFTAGAPQHDDMTLLVATFS